MRVIEQLVGYLRARGFLSTADLDYLRDEGYWGTPDDPADQQSPEHLLADAPPSAAEEAAFDLQESLEGRGRAGRGGGRRADPAIRAARREQAGELAALLAARRAAEAPALAGLIALGRALEAEADPDRALVALRETAPAALASVVAAALDAGRPTFAELWDGLTYEGFRATLADPALPRPAALGFRRVLAAGGQLAAGAFPWLLREPEVVRVCGLLRAQRAVLAAFGELEAAGPAPIGRWLRRDYHPLGYWALVLAHSARRPGPKRRGPGRKSRLYDDTGLDFEIEVESGDELELYQPPGQPVPTPLPPWHLPRRQVLAEDDWPRAWGLALGIDSAATRGLLGQIVGRETDGGDPQIGVNRLLSCPEEWDR